jgi:hypothetical protein
LYTVRLSALDNRHAPNAKKSRKFADAKRKAPAESPVPKINLGSHISSLLKRIPCNKLARQTGLVKRKPRKISPLAYIQAGLLIVTGHTISLAAWAILLGLMTQQTISKQAVFEQFDPAAVSFFNNVLACVLGLAIARPKCLSLDWDCPFARILVQDSTTVKLSEKLADVFPGGANQHGETPGVLRIQAIYDLLKQQWVDFSLSSYRRNDQKASPDILPHVQKGDLILRDLGYFAIAVLQQIGLRDAYFLSRYYFHTALFDTHGQKFDLLKQLRAKGSLDLWVHIGCKERMSVRLVAVPVPETVAAERRRKARAHLKNRCQLSNEYLALQGWTIFVTNVSKDILSAKQIMALYQQRWHIEMLFKAWKSHFQLEVISDKMSQSQLEVAIYCKLLFITMTYPLPLLPADRPNHGSERPRYYSLLKVSSITRQCILTILFQEFRVDVNEAFAVQLQYHGRYDRRQRKNLVEKLFALA